MTAICVLNLCFIIPIFDYIYIGIRVLCVWHFVSVWFKFSMCFSLRSMKSHIAHRFRIVRSHSMRSGWVAFIRNAHIFSQYRHDFDSFLLENLKANKKYRSKSKKHFQPTGRARWFKTIQFFEQARETLNALDLCIHIYWCMLVYVWFGIFSVAM